MRGRLSLNPREKLGNRKREAQEAAQTRSMFAAAITDGPASLAGWDFHSQEISDE
jgi:hypothetical protein